MDEEAPKASGKGMGRRALSKLALDQVTDGERDNEKLLRKLTSRMQRVGLDFPGVEIRWEDLVVETIVPKQPIKAAAEAACKKLDSSKKLNPTNGPSGPNASSKGGSDSRRRTILDAGSGVLPPGRMCLLLGPPGAGRTTLLRALSGQLVPPRAYRGKCCSSTSALSRWFSSAAADPNGGKNPDQGNGGAEPKAKTPVAEHNGLRVRGCVRYNGLPTHGPDFHVARAASFVSQTENHLPELTVSETLTFAARCQGAESAERLYNLLREREKEMGIEPDDPDLERLMRMAHGSAAATVTVELYARMLGIDHVMDTVVGNEMLKGISGGQKRRVTCGEMAVGKAHVLMLDEITNGLDASSALAIVKALRNMCEYANVTIVATLLQPSPEVVACFHDVMLMSGGRIAFHGPTPALLPFFGSLGLAPQPQQTMADFAQEVLASPADQARYRVALPGGAEGAGAIGPMGPPPVAWGHRRKWLSPRRVRNAFDASETGRAVAERLAAEPYTHSLHEIVLPTRKYGASTATIWGAVLRREAALELRNLHFVAAGVMQVLLTGFLLSTAFVRLSRSSSNDANLFMSAVFFSLMSMFMGGFNNAPVYCSRLPVFYKQRDKHFLTPTAYAVSATLMRLPEVALQSVMFGVMVYFSVGYTADAGRFFLFLLNLFLAGVNSVTTFQLLGAITRNDVITQGLGGCILMINTLVSGFPIARTSIPGWWIWCYWISPMSWNLRSMLVTELTSPAWPLLDAAGHSLGEDALLARGFHTEFKWVWAGLGYVAGMSLLTLAGHVLALTWLGPLRGASGAPVDEHEDEDDHPAATRSSADTHAAHGAHGHIAVNVVPKGAHAAPAATAGAIIVAGGDGAVAAPAPAADVQHGSVHGGGGGSVSRRSAAPSGTELAFAPVVFAFKDVCYHVPHPSEKGKQLQLLNRVSGVFRPGVLTSLMGASGAGKTTLMDVLAGRKTGGRAEGLQLVNGAPKRMASFARLMGYVEQVDVHNPYATVEEALLFSARLRVSSDTLPRSEVRSFVRRMMGVVELEPLAAATIGAGGPGGGLSTEARKRLTIAVELVANPSIVFMDEPTSGLDARAAGLVMRAVRNTVATGRTVVCTIHQPNREIMDHFDELLLLKPGGRTIYFGPLGPRQTTLISYLSGVPGDTEYQSHMNPADWMLEVTSPAVEAALGVDFAEVWAASPQASAANALVEQHTSSGTAAAAAAAANKHAAHAPTNGTNGGGAITAAFDVESGLPTSSASSASSAAASDGGPPPRFAQPLAMQLWLVTQRALVSQWRNTRYNGLRFAVAFGLAWVLGSLYWGRGDNRSSVIGLMDIMGVLFSAVLFLPLTNMLVVMPVVAADRAVFYREKASGMYRGAVFAAAQGLSEMPFLLVQSVIYVVIVYTTVHFEFQTAKAMWFWLYVWLDLMFFTFLGIGAMNMTPNMPAATASASLFILTWNLFCGFLIARKDIKPWYLWAYYFNPPTYAIYGCVATQMGDLTSEFITVGSETMSVAQYVRDTFSYDYDFRGWIVLIMVGFIVLVRGLSYTGLSFMNFQKR